MRPVQRSPAPSRRTPCCCCRTTKAACCRPPPEEEAPPDLGVAQWTFDHAEAAGLGTDTLPASAYFYLPMVAPMRTRGVLAIAPKHQRWLLIPEQRKQLDAFAALAAIALERVHYIEVAQQALVSMESERLRNSLLAALSHDLRTPLTLLVGLSESLLRARPALPEAQHETARVLHEESLRMKALVANLLDMARIESGHVKLDLQWQAIEEVVGSSLQLCGKVLAAHTVADAHSRQPAPAALRCRAAGAGAVQSAGECRQVHAGRLAHRDRSKRAGRSNGADGGRRRPRRAGRARRSHLRQIHPGRTGIGQAGRGPGPGHLPRHRPGPRRRHRGGTLPAGWRTIHG